MDDPTQLTIVRHGAQAGQQWQPESSMLRRSRNSTDACSISRTGLGTGGTPGAGRRAPGVGRRASGVGRRASGTLGSALALLRHAKLWVVGHPAPPHRHRRHCYVSRL
jgi:hypothetical protein